MTSSGELAINVIARQLLVDLTATAYEEAMDGHDHAGTLNGLTEGQRKRVVEEAQAIAQSLGPSDGVFEAAKRSLGLLTA